VDPVNVELRALDRRDLPAARQLLADACRFEDAAAVAEEKLYGPAPGAPRTDATAALIDGRLVGVVIASGRWLRLLAVAPDARRRGIGTVLLAAGEAAAAAAGAARARTLDQPGNYLAPGIDERDGDTIGWLERRGWRRCGDNVNLLVDVAGNPRAGAARAAELAAAAAAAGYQVRRARTDEAAALADPIGRAFSPPWAFEVERALAGDPPGVHLALHGGELAAFAVHDGNNRGLGWFGPAGTLPEHRGRGLGEALLVACCADVAAAGRARCEVAWIGPREFYARAVGIAGERRFAVLDKDLQEADA
jgi:ribosomal protein S18 acetylase RimI-like enzyme